METYFTAMTLVNALKVVNELVQLLQEVRNRLQAIVDNIDTMEINELVTKLMEIIRIIEGKIADS